MNLEGFAPQSCDHYFSGCGVLFALNASLDAPYTISNSGRGNAPIIVVVSSLDRSLNPFDCCILIEC